MFHFISAPRGPIDKIKNTRVQKVEDPNLLYLIYFLVLGAKLKERWKKETQKKRQHKIKSVENKVNSFLLYLLSLIN